MIFHAIGTFMTSLTSIFCVHHPLLLLIVSSVIVCGSSVVDNGNVSSQVCVCVWEGKGMKRECVFNCVSVNGRESARVREGG